MSSLIKTESVVVFTETDYLPNTTLKAIEERLAQDNVDALVLGQFPCHDLGYIDPITGECAVPNANAFAVSRMSYEVVGEVDNALRSARAADYVLRLKHYGKRIGLATDVMVPVYSHPPISQSWIDSVLFQYKYSCNRKRIELVKSVLNHVLYYDASLGNYSRKELLSEFSFFFRAIVAISRNIETVDLDPGRFFFLLENIRGWYTDKGSVVEHKPLVSLVLRTHNRPEVLRLTLNNLRRLDYPNYEIVLIEDGDPCAQKMVNVEFADLPIRYYSTRNPVGRAAAANIGFQLARGEWINLIDDDDFFFPEHIRIGIEKALAENTDMVFMQSVALDIISQKKPYSFAIKKMHHIAVPRIDPFTMSTECKASDNGVLFRKEVLEKAGWMREDLEAHEDWSLWLRMMAVGSWATVPYATCMFINPADEKEKTARMKQYSASDGKQYDDERLRYRTTFDENRRYYYGSACDFEALLVEGRLEQYLDDYLFRYRSYSDEHLSMAFAEWERMLDQRKDGVYTARQFHEWYCGMAYQLKRTEPELRQQLLTKWKDVSSS